MWTAPQYQRKRKGTIIARANRKKADGGEEKLNLAFLDEKNIGTQLNYVA